MRWNDMEMSTVDRCDVGDCSYNSGGGCRTMAINVGPHAECSTSFKGGNLKGGTDGTSPGVGACVSVDCRYNSSLECLAEDIDVTGHGGHADCRTFKEAS